MAGSSTDPVPTMDDFQTTVDGYVDHYEFKEALEALTHRVEIGPNNFKKKTVHVVFNAAGFRVGRVHARSKSQVWKVYRDDSEQPYWKIVRRLPQHTLSHQPVNFFN